MNTESEFYAVSRPIGASGIDAQYLYWDGEWHTEIIPNTSQYYASPVIMQWNQYAVMLDEDYYHLSGDDGESWTAIDNAGLHYTGLAWGGSVPKIYRWSSTYPYRSINFANYTTIIARRAPGLGTSIITPIKSDWTPKRTVFSEPGNIYILFIKNVPGSGSPDDGDLWFVKSENYGTDWDEPILVHSGMSAYVADIRMAVNEEDIAVCVSEVRELDQYYVGIDYYNLFPGPGEMRDRFENYHRAPYFTCVSHDGGETFSSMVETPHEADGGEYAYSSPTTYSGNFVWLSWYNGDLYVASSVTRDYLSTTLEPAASPPLVGWDSVIVGKTEDTGFLIEKLTGGEGPGVSLGYYLCTMNRQYGMGTAFNDTHNVIVCQTTEGIKQLLIDGAYSVVPISDFIGVQLQADHVLEGVPAGNYSFWW